MKSLTIRSYDKVVFFIIFILIAVQFILPVGRVNGKSISAITENLIYYQIHWSFNYFLIIMGVLLLGTIFFLLSLKYRKLYPYSSLWWCICVIALFIVEIKREALLESNISPEIVDLPIAPVTTIFLLLILALIQLIGEFYISRSKKYRAEFNKFIPFDVSTKYNLLYFILFITVVVLGGTLFGIIGVIIGALILSFIIQIYKWIKNH